MGILTPRLGLYKPADDGSEPVNVATDINDNLERLDAVVGAVPATAAVPPAGIFNGMFRQNTDTQTLEYFRNNTAWTRIWAAGAEFTSNALISLGNKIGIGTATPGALIDAFSNTVNEIYARFRQQGDTFSRLQLENNGIRLGPGNATHDVRLYRQNASTLNITGNVVMENGLQVTGVPSFNGITVTGQTNLDGDANLTGGADIQDHLTFMGFPMLVGQRGSGTINTNATNAIGVTINFGRTYPTPPTVVANITNLPGGSAGWTVRPLSITTTSFQAFFSHAAGTAGTYSLTYNWAAFHEGV